MPVALLWSRCVRARSLTGVWLCWTRLPSLGLLGTQQCAMGVRHGGGGRKVRGAWAGHLVRLGISAPSHMTASSSYKEKRSFWSCGEISKIIFAALMAPLDRREAVSKHSFLLGLREKCQIVGTLWEFL